MRTRAAAGFTLIELVVTAVVAGTMAAAFVALLVPQINLFFFLPHRSLVQRAASDLLRTVTEGDHAAWGVRYAGDGANTVTTASADSLTYRYVDNDGTRRTVVLTYDGATDTLSRQVDADPARNVPYYVNSTSAVRVEPLETNFFRYYDAAGTEMTGAGIVAANVYRVDLAARVGMGQGQVEENEGRVYVKIGVPIRRYVS